VLISVPREVTPVERRAFREVARRTGASEVVLIDEPLAAAIGSGLPVCEPRGSMLVDVGSGITEAAVISLGEIVHCHSIRLGGQSMDEAIAAHTKERYGLLIGERSAEEAKIRLAGNSDHEPAPVALVKGRWLQSGLPGTVQLTAREILDALSGQIEAIAENVVEALDQTPPELVADICSPGISLTGGGALLGTLAERVHGRTGVPVNLVPDPLGAVALGNGRMLSQPEELKGVRLGH
jgi:rod shape-determining protein MreB